MSGAALRPGRGYPPSLFNEVGSHAGACDFRMLEAAGNRVRTDRGVLEYRPDPEVAGVIPGYRLALFPQGGGAGLETDHHGQVRALAAVGAAPTLESVEAARPAEALKGADLFDRRGKLAASCEGGDLAVCEDLGQFEYDNDRPWEAGRWWDHACEKGRLQSCLLSGRYNPTADPRNARSDKERCIRGEARYCKRLEDEALAMKARIEELRKQGGFQRSSDARGRTEEKRRELAPLCEGGNAELCENLGDLEWDTQRRAESLRWWDRACELGRLRTCLLGERYNPGQDREPILALRSECRQADKNACAALDAIVQKMRPAIEARLAKGRQ
jgi:hypothetical protein